jgi:hypothetical protein
MVSEEEFVTAMFFAIVFGFCTLLLLIRNRRLKKQVRKLRVAHEAKAVEVAAPALPVAREPDPQIQEMKERIKVLERITVEREGSLAREFELLRERP